MNGLDSAVVDERLCREQRPYPSPLRASAARRNQTPLHPRPLPCQEIYPQSRGQRLSSGPITTTSSSIRISTAAARVPSPTSVPAISRESVAPLLPLACLCAPQPWRLSSSITCPTTSATLATTGVKRPYAMIFNQCAPSPFRLLHPQSLWLGLANRDKSFRHDGHAGTARSRRSVRRVGLLW